MLPASPTAAHVPPKREPDAVVIGSGVGGSMAAHGLMGAGLDVLLIERGVPVERGEHNWDLDAAFELSPYFNMESHYRLRGETRGRKGTFQCVGGPSVFYGGVALRLRAADFDQRAEIVRDTGAAWPVSYDDLAPYYRRAEEILGVAGRPARHPVDPADTVVHPYRAPALQGPARLIRDAAAGLGLNPSHLPLAIDFEGDGAGSGTCMQCGTCDGYACAVSAKREPSTAVLPALVEKGLRLVSNTVAVRILWRGRRIAGVVGIDRDQRPAHGLHGKAVHPGGRGAGLRSSGVGFGARKRVSGGQLGGAMSDAALQHDRVRSLPAAIGGQPLLSQTGGDLRSLRDPRRRAETRGDPVDPATSARTDRQSVARAHGKIRGPVHRSVHGPPGDRRRRAPPGKPGRPEPDPQRPLRDSPGDRVAPLHASRSGRAALPRQEWRRASCGPRARGRRRPSASIPSRTRWGRSAWATIPRQPRWTHGAASGAATTCG